MPKRISKCSHEYAGRNLSKGDPFEVDPEHVALLLLLGRIEPEGQYQVRDMTASAPHEYRTREMAAGTLHVKRKYTKRKVA